MPTSNRPVVIVALAAVFAGLTVACGDSADPEPVIPGDPVFEIVSDGGFTPQHSEAAVHPDGAMDCTEDYCPLQPPQGSVRGILEELAASGYFEGADRDYETSCCDMVTVTITARTTTRARTVRGTLDRVPEPPVRGLRALAELVDSARVGGWTARSHRTGAAVLQQGNRFRHHPAPDRTVPPSYPRGTPGSRP